jgi:hypothetical protein
MEQIPSEAALAPMLARELAMAGSNTTEGRDPHWSSPMTRSAVLPSILAGYDVALEGPWIAVVILFPNRKRARNPR